MGFEFKRFRIEDDLCAQKVCTDSILLGSWVEIKQGSRVLDIGSGCGLLAIMLAQRCEGVLNADGVELDKQACEQSINNAKNSPWPDVIHFHCADINHYQVDAKYDVIVSNPPYFQQSLKGPNAKRNQARHTDSLSFEQMLACVERLLSTDGQFSVVLPTTGANELQLLAPAYRLQLTKRLQVCTVTGKTPKLQLLSFVRAGNANVENANSKEFSGEIDGQLVIRDTNGHYSSQFIALTQNFYLNR